MNNVSLMEKLLKVERAHGDEEPVTVGVMVYEAHECILHMQLELVCTLTTRAGFVEKPRALRN